MNHYIDHTLLLANATTDQINTLCDEAHDHQFFSVCVNPRFVEHCAQRLKASNVKICTVIGFPLGANTTAVKVFETQNAISLGADEIDMVVNVSDVLDAKWGEVEREISAIKDACGQTLLKVIFETCLLTNEQIVELCHICKRAGADYVKTSTGFSTGGATVEHITLMRDTVGNEIGVKASGGVRTRETAQAMIDAGASRVGASASVSIVSGENPITNGY
ncbi:MULTISPECIES: deoxyribose-phosphate aldolase [Vibrio]|uniref:deoxyribose-phosphate aldolase n=1 Tax=Vibrio TaxID=662 RepID=UPI00215B8C99|nr:MULTISPECIES: deoxyribose-phosphate aldolase [Vibrio]MCR9641038.1 deoxyribose-phosphate aldolase [Vibrio alginolyticus]MDW1579764.1 deoxyribose-phosphate aldolase [Vibrio sp. Vb2897]MDW1585919.1 deoxyribose-phosphate aldolase [Vibrio sp. Vb2910]MDW1594784.1 deoxyribose-phosphate aldolase [Vibrio sp. Vb2911]MDW1605374.1 deoxyribose-phosphate aldolase [Vibrio sp. Vb2977]